MRKFNKNQLILGLLMLTCGIPFLGHSQIDRKVVKPVDIARQTIQTIEANENWLYKATSIKRADQKVILTLSRTRGVIWQPLSSILLNANPEISGMIAHGDQVLIYGRFSYNITPQPSIQRNILEFNKQWIFRKDFSDFDNADKIMDAAVFGDSIIIGGNFNSLGGQKVNNLAFYHKGNFSPLKDLNDSVGCNNTITHIEVEEDIYVSGSFSKAGSIAAKALAKFDLNNWTSLATGHGFIPKFTLLDKDIFFRSSSMPHQIRKIERTTLTESAANLGLDSIYRLSDIFSFNNQLMIIGDVRMTSGYRTGWLTYNSVFWSSVNGSRSCLIATSNSKELFIYGQSLLGFLSQVKNNYIGSYLPSRKLIFGNLYFDFNKSCKIDSGDYPIAKTAIRFGNDKFASYSNESGVFYHYYEKVEDKTPKVILDNSYFNYELCIPDSNDLKNITSDLIGPIEILLQPRLIEKAKLQTRAIVHNGRRLKKSGRSLVTYLVRNVGFKDATNVSVELGGKSKLNKFISIPAADEKDTFFQWNLGTIKPFEVKAITISFALQSNIDVLKNVIDFQIDHEYFNSVNMDAGSDFFDQEVTDEDFTVAKEQSLLHNAPLENNAIAATDTIIEYQINFQNRTNDIIQDIVVIDTVDLTYNLLYTKTISSSHDFIETIEQDPLNPNIGYIIYNFRDINLAPNSSANPEITNDQGYVRLAFVFSKQHSMNDEIENTATVIMNNNLEYSTNTVIAKVDRMSSNNPVVQQRTTDLYPNPFNTDIYFNIELGSNLDFKVYNVQGAEVSAGTSQGQTISLKHLKPGIYLVKIVNDDGIWTSKCLKY